jgi:hypothetical protein
MTDLDIMKLLGAAVMRTALKKAGLADRDRGKARAFLKKIGVPVKDLRRYRELLESSLYDLAFPPIAVKATEPDRKKRAPARPARRPAAQRRSEGSLRICSQTRPR